jgi:hypothetical protein
MTMRALLALVLFAGAPAFARAQVFGEDPGTQPAPGAYPIVGQPAPGGYPVTGQPAPDGYPIVGQPTVVPQQPAYGVQAQSPGVWPSSPSRPDGAYNPSFSYGPDGGLVAAGLALFLIGYVDAIVVGSVAVAAIQGNPTEVTAPSYPRYDESCINVTGGLTLVPLVGALIGAIHDSTCRTASYERIAGGYELTSWQGSTNLPVIWSNAIPSTVFQLLGFSLLVAGLAANVPGVAFEAALDRQRGIELAVLGDVSGISLRLRHR